MDVRQFLVMLGDFEDELSSQTTKECRKQYIVSHFYRCDNTNHFQIPKFNEACDWLNASSQLKFGDRISLQGKVVLLDFFTYCCINCLHILPDLSKLEQKHSVEDGLVIIGVHSAKFFNEKVTGNILNAVLKHDISHPVVNDREALLWDQLCITCWPTLVLVGPHGQVLYYIVGEGKCDRLFELVDLAIEHYRTQLSLHSLPLLRESDKQHESLLRFPGNVHYITSSDQLVISDSSHHRLLIVDAGSGVVQFSVGGVERGFKDGDFDHARFNDPHGIGSHGNLIFVADTGNDALRQVDLHDRIVSTLYTSRSGNSDESGEVTINQQNPLSPWDVAVGVSPGGQEVDVVYIAMAGAHQIWIYCLTDVQWWKGRAFAAGSCVCVAGSGVEGNRNNAYPHQAAFAQPSGLSLSPVGCLGRLFVADSESSSVRQISLKNGRVTNLVGGDRDPTNLFDAGDIDGVGVDAKLQHPLAVCLLAPMGPLLVVDSYNHKLKCVDVDTRQCSTVLATVGPHSGPPSAVWLNEPGGVSVCCRWQRVYIADTNNHCIKVLEWKERKVSELPLIFSKQSVTKDVVNFTSLKDCEQLPPVTVKSGSQLNVFLHIALCKGVLANQNAPNTWKLKCCGTVYFFMECDAEGPSNSSISASSWTGQIPMDSAVPQLLTSLTISGSTPVKVTLACQVFSCLGGDACSLLSRQFVLDVVLSDSGHTDYDLVAKWNIG